MKKVMTGVVLLLMLPFLLQISAVTFINASKYTLHTIQGDTSILQHISYEVGLGTALQNLTLTMDGESSHLGYHYALSEQEVIKTADKEYVDPIEPYGEWKTTVEESYDGDSIKSVSRDIKGAHITYHFQAANGHPIDIQTNLTVYSNDVHTVRECKKYTLNGSTLLYEPLILDSQGEGNSFYGDDTLIQANREEIYFMPRIDEFVEGHNAVYYSKNGSVEELITLPEHRNYVSLTKMKDSLLVVSYQGEHVMLDKYDLQGKQVDSISFPLSEWENLGNTIFTNDQYLIMLFEKEAVVLDVDQMKIVQEPLNTIDEYAVDVIYKNGILYQLNYVTAVDQEMKIVIQAQKNGSCMYQGEIKLRGKSKQDDTSVTEILSVQSLQFLREE